MDGDGTGVGRPEPVNGVNTDAPGFIRRFVVVFVGEGGVYSTPTGTFGDVKVVGVRGVCGAVMLGVSAAGRVAGVGVGELVGGVGISGAGAVGSVPAVGVLVAGGVVDVGSSTTGSLVASGAGTGDGEDRGVDCLGVTSEAGGELSPRSLWPGLKAGGGLELPFLAWSWSF